eukprot:TRINITY_DN19527_c0_g1_i1.p2 TRINITY_DN19527_c0_g1~~TRINITY_DN19527_c0_g1_i1.p2  ORF type:complete len:242 (+),score=35.03 TRINITY_DN19527_c0_g1_i1:72-728(+)
MAGTSNKIFVGGLPQNCSKDVLSNYFMQYGTITDACVMLDRETQRSRGFGFITYDSTGPVDMVMAQYDDHKIEGKWVEVKRAVAKDQMAPGESGKGGSKGRSNKGNDNRGGSAGAHAGAGTVAAADGGGAAAAAAGIPGPAAGYGMGMHMPSMPMGGVPGVAYPPSYGTVQPGYGAVYGNYGSPIANHYMQYPGYPPPQYPGYPPPGGACAFRGYGPY